MHLLNKNDLLSIFNSSILYENESFFIIDPLSQEYDTQVQYSSIIDYASKIEEAYNNGRTIIVKNLENFSQKIAVESLQYGDCVDTHMYLVPPSGSDSFKFHKDSCAVTIKMIYGKKTFELRDHSGNIKSYNLTEGEKLEIPLYTDHRAIPTGGSCLLSFGDNGARSYPIGSFFESCNFDE